jgi:hypothetical protein
MEFIRGRYNKMYNEGATYYEIILIDCLNRHSHFFVDFSKLERHA